jgi:hypothetical protein
MSGKTTAAEPFRNCGSCGYAWKTWEEFVHDPKLTLLGMQIMETHPAANLIVFEHSCGSSVSVLASRLRHLLPEFQRYRLALFGTGKCSDHCRTVDNLALCDRPCANARDRRLALLLHEIRQQAGLT